MWCDHCHEDVNTTRSPVTGQDQCEQCGSELQRETNAENPSIAQTAQALLKRWEESRDFRETGGKETPEPSKTSARTEQTTSHPSAQEATNERQELEKRSAPNQFSQGSETGEDFSEDFTPLVPQNSQLRKGPRQPERDSFQSSPAPKQREPQPANSGPSQDKEPASKPAPDFANLAHQRDPQRATPASFIASKRTDIAEQSHSQTMKERDKPMPSSKVELPENDPHPVRQESESSNSLDRKQVVERSLQSESSAPPLRKPRNRDGQIRFTPRQEVQNPISEPPPSHDEQKSQRGRNWSAIIGQLLVFFSALGMTGGIGLVIAAKFGASVPVAESTGWLMFAGSHLLFVLGVYTNLSSRMEQVLDEMHQRNDELTNLITYQKTLSGTREEFAKTGQPLHSNEPDMEFSRSSLEHEVSRV